MYNWRKIEEIFNETVSLPADERNSFLRARCGGNEEIFGEVRELLETDECEPQFFEFSAFTLGTRLIESEFNTTFLAKRFAHYKNLKLLSRGNPQAVFTAENNETRETEVLKILPSVNSLDFQTVNRFKVEAEITAAVANPHIVRINNFDIYENHFYIAMEHIGGYSLRSLLMRGKIEFKQAVRICRQIGDGLSALHHHGIAHGDLKPENILISIDGKAVIIDFGSAIVFDEKLYPGDYQAVAMPSSDDLIIGTPAYMSPEQHMGDKSIPPSDLWSLAAIMHEMISGERLFSGLSSAEIKKLFTSGLYRLSGNFSSECQDFFNKCFAPELNARYDCVGTLIEDFADLTAHLSLPQTHEYILSGN